MENADTRRSVLKKMGAGIAGTGSLAAFGATRASAYSITMEVEHIVSSDPQKMDYLIHVNDHSPVKGDKANSGDSVTYLSNGNTEIYGQLYGRMDTYEIAKEAEIVYVWVGDSTSGGNGKVWISTGPDRYYDPTGPATLSGYNDYGNTMKYTVTVENSVSRNSDTEWPSDDTCGSGCCFGELKDGGQDVWDLEGQTDRIELVPAGGDIYYDREMTQTQPD